MSDQAPGIGDNRIAWLNSVDLMNMIAPDVVEAIKELLAHHYCGLEEERNLYLISIEEWITKHTPKKAERPSVADEEDDEATVEFLKQLDEFGTKVVEPARLGVKSPITYVYQEIDKFFNDGLKKAIKDGAAPIRTAHTFYLTKKKEKARQDLLKKAWAAQKVAEEMAEKARRTQDTEDQANLVEMSSTMQDVADAAAHQAATASGRELTRGRTETGLAYGLISKWKWRLEGEDQDGGKAAMMDLIMAAQAGRVPPEAFTLRKEYMDEYVKKYTNTRPMPGVHIYEEDTAR